MKKRLVSLLLALTILLSFCVCGAEDVKTAEDYLNLFHRTLDGQTIGVPINLQGMIDDEEVYKERVYGDVGNACTFRAVLVMDPVIEQVTNLLTEADAVLDDEDKAALLEIPVTGSFTITATLENEDGLDFCVSTPGDLTTGALAGFTFDGAATSDIFEEGATRRLSAHTVITTINVKVGVTVGDLVNLPEKIVLEMDDFEIAEDGQVEGTFEGQTVIKAESFGQENGRPFLKDITINYDAFDAITERELKEVPVVVRKPSSGSIDLTTFYNVSFEENGGSLVEDLDVVAGKTVNLTQTSTKEGFVFDGWYADAALTEKITSVVVDKNITVYAAWKAEGESDDPITEAHPVPEILEGEDHFAYLSGYPDGTIRPDANITRAEVATIFFRLLKDNVRVKYLSKTNDFSDVSADDWFNTAVSTLANAGVLSGHSDGTFAPNDYITRAEFTAICARFDHTDDVSANHFTDISDHWAEDYILECVSYGWIQGYADYSFRPEGNITRAEAATLINRVLLRVPADKDALLSTMVKWPDNSDEAAWYYIAIQEATNSHTYGRINAFNEEWIEIKGNRDWTIYEK